ncbi:50S ribosomal protein L4 [Candidatus Parcubacteria bacterium]|nr:MAG: 50S ribosomal protein L4 [Candidatus Parcubacteria bacterium]
MNIGVYNQEGNRVGEMELPAAFAMRWNANLVHQVVTSELANRRPTVAHTRGRSEVRGGGKKPWRQKGTGRARHGSIRSPIWKGGGVTHGPTKEHDFKKKINRRMAAKALAMVLGAKARDHELVVVDTLQLGAPKTKQAAAAFANIAKGAAIRDWGGKKPRALLLLPKKDEIVIRASRNIPFLELMEARNVTALDALNRKYVVAPQEAIAVLAERLKRAA